MDPEWIRAVASTLSGEAAKRYTEEITMYYRSPGSSGYHAATDLVRDAFTNAKIPRVVVERYPLDGVSNFLGSVMPPAWEPISAELRLLPEQDLLVDYPTIPSCLPWYCPATPQDGLEVEILDVGQGLSEADYAGRDVAGKAVLVRHGGERPGWLHAVDLARRHGAQGIVSDYLLAESPPWRTRESLPEAVQLMRLPARSDNPWTFIVAYPTAERLAARCRLGLTRIHARISARLFKGEGQNLIATIPGHENSEEAVMFIAHTSAGTRPCANCAAGPALMIEIARTLMTLIDGGTIPYPRRSIRFMAVAEGLGSKAFIARHPESLGNTLYAMCFDSVGHHQDRLKSSLNFYRTPDSVPSYVNDLGQWLLDHLPKEAMGPFKNDPVIPLVTFVSLPYNPASDEHHWNSMGVPTPLIRSWPDIYFHTQLLTADHTDPKVFHRAGLVTTLLALAVANAGAAEAGHFARLVSAYAGLRIGLAAERGLQEYSHTMDAAALDRAAAEVCHLEVRDTRAVETTAVFVRHESNAVRVTHGEVMEDIKGQIKSRVREALQLIGARSRLGDEAAPSSVPVKLVIEPAPNVCLEYSEQVALIGEMQAIDFRVCTRTLEVVNDELWNLSDGLRTIREIGEIIGFEFGLRIEPQHVESLARGLERRGYLVLQPASLVKPSYDSKPET